MSIVFDQTIAVVAVDAYQRTLAGAAARARLEQDRERQRQHDRTCEALGRVFGIDTVAYAKAGRLQAREHGVVALDRLLFDSTFLGGERWPRLIVGCRTCGQWRPLDPIRRLWQLGELLAKLRAGLPCTFGQHLIAPRYWDEPDERAPGDVNQMHTSA